MPFQYRVGLYTYKSLSVFLFLMPCQEPPVIACRLNTGRNTHFIGSCCVARILGSATVTIRCLRTHITGRIVTVPRTQALPTAPKPCKNKTQEKKNSAARNVSFYRGGPCQVSRKTKTAGVHRQLLPALSPGKGNSVFFRALTCVLVQMPDIPRRIRINHELFERTEQ